MKAQQIKPEKLHSFPKSERLCNFTLKKLLFEQGNSFSIFPFRVFWKTVPQNLEEIFFQKSITHYQPSAKNLSEPLELQNPCFPHRKIPANAFFVNPVQCLCSASGKVHKKAVIRNKLKRLIREAYRNNKQGLLSFMKHSEKFCLVGIIYTGTTVLSYDEVEKKIIVSLQKIQDQIKQQQID